MTRLGITSVKQGSPLAPWKIISGVGKKRGVTGTRPDIHRDDIALIVRSDIRRPVDRTVIHRGNGTIPLVMLYSNPAAPSVNLNPVG